MGIRIVEKALPCSGRPPNITLRVMTRTEVPFVMKRRAKEGEVLEGNERLEVLV